MWLSPASSSKQCLFFSLPFLHPFIWPPYSHLSGFMLWAHPSVKASLALLCSPGLPEVAFYITRNLSFVFGISDSSWGNPKAHVEENNYRSPPYLPFSLSLSHSCPFPPSVVKHNLFVMSPFSPSVNENRKDLCCSQTASSLLAATKGC